MTYQKELLYRINDNEKWPEFDRPDFLDELNEIADKSVQKKTIEGYLAALLIYQQLTEEAIRLFLKDHEFYIQLSVFPNEIKFANKSNAMFGRVIEDLKNTVTFDNSKFEIIDRANKINQIRIELVHGLTKIPNLQGIESKVLAAKKLYDELFELFDEEHDMFRVTFNQFRKNGDLEGLLEE
jgi:hypothetical protein